jgi:hypothetical protein
MVPQPVPLVNRDGGGLGRVSGHSIWCETGSEDPPSIAFPAYLSRARYAALGSRLMLELPLTAGLGQRSEMPANDATPS